MNWHAFRVEAPQLAELFEERLTATGICLVGTIRADGWPRISPNEASIMDGELMLEMMWQSLKARDLARDPRITVVTPQADHQATHGDLKLYGLAVEVSEPACRHAYAAAQEAATGARPTKLHHLFTLDVQRAGFISFGAKRQLLRWTPDGGIERLRHPGDNPQ